MIAKITLIDSRRVREFIAVEREYFADGVKEMQFGPEYSALVELRVVAGGAVILHHGRVQVRVNVFLVSEVYLDLVTAALSVIFLPLFGYLITFIDRRFVSEPFGEYRFRLRHFYVVDATLGHLAARACGMRGLAYARRRDGKHLLVFTLPSHAPRDDARLRLF